MSELSLQVFEFFFPLSDCVVMMNNATCVILNKVKNLMHSIRYTTQILRLTPQNDIATQPLRGRIGGVR